MNLIFLVLCFDILIILLRTYGNVWEIKSTSLALGNPWIFFQQFTVLRGKKIENHWCRICRLHFETIWKLDAVFERTRNTLPAQSWNRRNYYLNKQSNIMETLRGTRRKSVDNNTVYLQHAADAVFSFAQNTVQRFVYFFDRN